VVPIDREVIGVETAAAAPAEPVHHCYPAEDGFHGGGHESIDPNVRPGSGAGCVGTLSHGSSWSSGFAESYLLFVGSKSRDNLNPEPRFETPVRECLLDPVSQLRIQHPNPCQLARFGIQSDARVGMHDASLRDEHFYDEREVRRDARYCLQQTDRVLFELEHLRQKVRS